MEIIKMSKFIMAATLMSLAIPLASTSAIADPPGWSHGDRNGREDRKHERRDERREDRRDYRNDYRNNYRSYDYNRPDPRYGNYRAERYYTRDDHRAARRLSNNDRIYRGRDNRYYCRHSDGTTGLIIGGLAGGVLGNAVAPGGSKTLGTLLGGGAGALIGRSIDRDGGVRCR
jgi:hypothetical protein